MKINQLTRFPYPVLVEHTNDYKSGRFSVDIEISESVKTGGLLIRNDIQLTEDTINDLILNKTAKICLFVTCRETYYNNLHEITGTNGLLEIEKGLLSGSVNLLPLVILSNDIESYECINLHEDYNDHTIRLEAGSVLAIGDEYTINVGREKLAPIESIFELAVSDSVSKGQYSANLDREKITVLAETNTYRSINNIRNTNPGKAMLLNSIYLPVIMEILSALQQDPDLYQDKHWFKIFQAKCTHENINIENPELLKDAQTLLKTPFNKVISIMSEMD